jgi:hypothetical protein
MRTVSLAERNSFAYRREIDSRTLYRIGRQIEAPDPWLAEPNPFEIARNDVSSAPSEGAYEPPLISFM